MRDAVDEKNTTGQVPPEEGWDEQRAVTGRPNDVPSPNSTFAERAGRVKAAVVDTKTVVAKAEVPVTVKRPRRK